MELSRWKWLFIVSEALLLVGFLILAFWEKDYRTSIEVIVAAVAIAIEVLLSKSDKAWLHIIIIIGLLVEEVIWAWGIWLNSKEEQTNDVEEVLADNTDKVIRGMKAELVELDMNKDPLLKSLDKYTNVTGADQERMQSVITEKIRTWKEGWNSLTLGTVSGEYADARGRVDEIYTIRCIPEAESVYLQDDAINDYDLCIEGIETLYGLYSNPELKKEEAAMHLEKGDLCQKLGRESEADAAYHESIVIAWEGLE